MPTKQNDELSARNTKPEDLPLGSPFMRRWLWGGTSIAFSHSIQRTAGPFVHFKHTSQLFLTNVLKAHWNTMETESETKSCIFPLSLHDRFCRSTIKHTSPVQKEQVYTSGLTALHILSWLHTSPSLIISAGLIPAEQFIMNNNSKKALFIIFSTFYDL